jgi:hypothetical protein
MNTEQKTQSAAREAEQLTESQFRKEVKIGWPYVKISVRTVGFHDLARSAAKCLTVTGDKRGDLQHINALAKRAGILPDGNCRFFED